MIIAKLRCVEVSWDDSESCPAASVWIRLEKKMNAMNANGDRGIKFNC